MTRSTRRGTRWDLVLGLALVIVALSTSSASGFSLTPWRWDEPIHLDHAVRWSVTDSAFVDTGSRGLGGGLEYALDDRFCDWMRPYIVDEPTPSCAEIRAAVGRAFSRWGAEHPQLKFVDVTDQVTARLAERDGSSGGGAEVDVFAAQHFQDHNPRFRDATAYARVLSRNSRPQGTNGQRMPGETITEVDIVIDVRGCSYLDPELTGTFDEPCSHLPSLMMHEIGHGLGLDHPYEFPNYHSEDDPTKPIEIDCENPTRGLQVIDNHDAHAVMANGISSYHFHRRLGHDRAHLRPDDIGGRNFLYPVCDDEPQANGASIDIPWIAGLAFGIGLRGILRRVR